MPRKHTIRMGPDEKAALEALSLDKRIATDRYTQLPEALAELTEAFNALTGRGDSPQEILHYMRTRRKNHQWSRFDGAHRRIPQLGNGLLSENQREELVNIYVELGVACDNFAHDRALANQLARMFLDRTGRNLPGLLLAMALTELRKDGLLPTLEADDGDGFTDLDHAEEA